MKYEKPEALAQNTVNGVFAAGCPEKGGGDVPVVHRHVRYASNLYYLSSCKRPITCLFDRAGYGV